MNAKDISEIRKHCNPSKTNITRFYGCYVNQNKEIVSTFMVPFSRLTEDEQTAYMKIIKKGISGKLERDLHELEFATESIGKSEQHKLLMELRNPDANIENALKALYQQIVMNLPLDEEYMILLASETFDINSKHKDDAPVDSENGQSYFVCCSCPLAAKKSDMRYSVDKKYFELSNGKVVKNPEVGIMFPTLSDRCTDIGSALMYNKNKSVDYTDFVKNLFGITRTDIPASEQKKKYNQILQESLRDECTAETLTNIAEAVDDIAEASEESETTTLDYKGFSKALDQAGVSEERIEEFGEMFKSEFGDDVRLCPENLINMKKTVYKTGNIKITAPLTDTGRIHVVHRNGRAVLQIELCDELLVNDIPTIT